MPENFVSRWARLKRSSETRRKPESISNGPPVDAVASTGTEAISGHFPSGEIMDEPFDPASLPAIETITVNTDIRGFLQSRVPVELTRAALRQAWASDPAIRDFIGIAENQWDFNDPDAMPGFGPLRESDDLPALLARAQGRHDDLAGVVSEMPVSVPQSLPAAADHEVVAPEQNAPQAFDGSPRTDDINSSPDTGCSEGEAAGNDGVAEAMEPPRYRPHGSALPR
jgi:hypothetical protein